MPILSRSLPPSPPRPSLGVAAPGETAPAASRPAEDRMDPGAPEPTVRHLPAAPAQGPRTPAAFAYFGLAPTRPQRPPPEPVEPVRPRAAPPPAAIGSTSQSRQSSGAGPLSIPAHARIQLWAAPGATIRVYNASVLEDGAPKLLKEVKAPNTDEGVGLQPMAHAYPALETYSGLARGFRAVPHDGHVLATLDLSPADDQDARDLFLLTQETVGRAESEPLPVRLVSYSPLGREREPTIDVSRLEVAQGTLRASHDYAVTPGTPLALHVDGLPTARRVVADDRGRFALDLHGLGDPSRIQLVAETRHGHLVDVDLSGLGLSARRAPAAARVARLEQEITRGFLSAPVQGRLRFDVGGLPDGAALVVTSSAAPGDRRTFVARQGVLTVDLDGVAPGDGLSVRLDLSRLDPTLGEAADRRADRRDPLGRLIEPAHDRLRLSGPGGSASLVVDRTFSVPTPELAERIGRVIDAFPNARQEELGFAVELFAPAAAGARVEDEDRMARILTAAKLGSAIPPTYEGKEWIARIEGHLGTHDPSGDLLAGLRAGVEYGRRNRYRSLAARPAAVGLHQTAKEETVITRPGGYDRLRPWESRPLDQPQWELRPAEYELRLADVLGPGAPAIPPLTGLRGGSLPLALDPEMFPLTRTVGALATDLARVFV